MIFHFGFPPLSLRWFGVWFVLHRGMPAIPDVPYAEEAVPPTLVVNLALLLVSVRVEIPLTWLLDHSDETKSSK